MGFKQGTGLGRYGQGRADIVEASQQRGRRGLGFRVEGFDDKDFTWDEEEVLANVQLNVPIDEKFTYCLIRLVLFKFPSYIDEIRLRVIL